MSVTPEMLAVALGQAAPEPASVMYQQWQMWVEDAYMLVEVRRAKIAPDMFLDQARLDYVIREVVVAHIKKPDDATQVTIAVDDASTSKTYQSGKGRVTIVDEFWALLGLLEPESGAYSIDTVGTATRHLPWCTLFFGATYCSCGTDLAGSPIFEGDGI
jgi:hypothetical protein